MATNSPSDDFVFPYHSSPKKSLCPGVTRQRRDVRAVENTTSSRVEGDEGARPHFSCTHTTSHWEDLKQCSNAFCRLPWPRRKWCNWKKHDRSCHDEVTASMGSVSWVLGSWSCVIVQHASSFRHVREILGFSRHYSIPFSIPFIYIYSVIFGLFSRPPLLMKTSHSHFSHPSSFGHETLTR